MPARPGTPPGNDDREAPMDGSRFDDLLRRLSRGQSRRAALRSVFAGALGLSPAAALADDAASPGADRKRRKCKPPCENGFTCSKGRCVCKRVTCSGVCCPADWSCWNGVCIDLCPGLTVFGSGPGSGFDQFDMPRGIAVTADDSTALIADSGNDRIAVWRNFGSGWEPVSTFGSYGSGNGQFEQPNGVALAEDELTAWVADTLNTRVSVWTRPSLASNDWTWQTHVGTTGYGPDEFYTVSDVSVSPDGLTLWATDRDNERVSVWQRPDAWSTAWTHLGNFGSGPGSGVGQFDKPLGLAVSPDARTAWVADSENDQVSVWQRAEGAPLGTWTFQATFGDGPGSTLDELWHPSDISVTPDGIFALVTDSVNGRVAIWRRTSLFGSDWTNLSTFGEPGTMPDQFGYPWGIHYSLLGNGAAWVVDRALHRVAVWPGDCLP